MYTISTIEASGAHRLVADKPLSGSEFDAIKTALADKGDLALSARKSGYVAAYQFSSSAKRGAGAPAVTGAKKGDWIVTNMSRGREIIKTEHGQTDTYIVPDPYFHRAYDRDEGSNEFGDVYRPNSTVDAVELTGGAEILAPWGERQSFEHCYLIRNAAEVYCIDAKIFRSTYTNGEAQREKGVVVKRVNRVFDGFLKIDEAQFSYTRYDGTIAKDVTRLSLERGDAAGALLLDCRPGSNAGEPRVWLIEQFRYSTYQHGPGWIQELPTGVIEDGEDPVETVRREVWEETGLKVGDLELVSVFYPSPGGCSERVFVYFARVDGQTPSRKEGLGVAAEGEDIRLFDCPAEEFMKRAKLGDINDAKTLIAGLWLSANWERLSAR